MKELLNRQVLVCLFKPGLRTKDGDTESFERLLPISFDSSEWMLLDKWEDSLGVKTVKEKYRYVILLIND